VATNCCWLRCSIAILAVQSLAVTSSGGPSEVGSPEPDEYRVYGAIVDKLFANGRSWIMVSRPTVSFDCEHATVALTFGGCRGGMKTKNVSAVAVLQQGRNQLPESDDAAWTEFAVRNANEWQLKEAIPASRRCVLWSEAGGGPLPPGTPDYSLYFSRVGFDPKGEQGVVFVAAVTWLAAERKGGYFVHVARGPDGRWAMRKSRQLWE
jgi:hypothetical protein